MYLLYFSLCIISTVITYFFIPETKRLPVEEIGALFGDEVIVHLTADGYGIVEDGKVLKDEHLEEAAISVRDGQHNVDGEKRSATVTHMERAGAET